MAVKNASRQTANINAVAVARAQALRADIDNWSMLDGDGCVDDCYAMAKSITPTLAPAAAAATPTTTTATSATSSSSSAAAAAAAAAAATTAAATTITAIHTRKGTTTITFVLLLILCCLCDYNYGSWAAQCWKKHNSGSIQTPDGEFKRPFGILCTYRCFLWFPPIYPYCEFIFDLRLSRHFTSFPDCYEVRCNETFSFFGSEHNY